jgi:hypothetical protein
MPLIIISLPQEVSPPRKSRKVKIIIKTENSKAFATEGTEPQIESSFIPLPRPRGRGEGEGAFPEKKS